MGLTEGPPPPPRGVLLLRRRSDSWSFHAELSFQYRTALHTDTAASPYIYEVPKTPSLDLRQMNKLSTQHRNIRNQLAYYTEPQRPLENTVQHHAIYGTPIPRAPHWRTLLQTCPSQHHRRHSSKRQQTPRIHLQRTSRRSKTPPKGPRQRQPREQSEKALSQPRPQRLCAKSMGRILEAIQRHGEVA